MSLTTAQQQAIAARGNVLVMAGAGTGKTRTLVARCIDCLLHESPPASIEEILMVTFTDAAAAEMRQRIRARLEEELEKDSSKHRWREQLALFETAHIGTLHGFCFRLIRQHFYGLGLDPQLSVMAEEESRLVAEEQLDSLLAEHYREQTPLATAVQQLIRDHGQGSDATVRPLIMALHHYTQTLPDPAAWFEQQLECFESEEPVHWERWLIGGLAEWRDRSIPVLKASGSGNPLANEALGLLNQVQPSSRQQVADILKTICDIPKSCPYGKKKIWVEPLTEFWADAKFLSSLTQANSGTNPLREDWSWVRSQMSTLVHLARDFGQRFAEAKRELAMVDFHDIEQFALKLLWDQGTNQPSVLARQWRQKLRFVFVDEYQDINAAQDKIIEALSLQGADANRFLVGDVKQSIYRFRLADPSIFQRYVRDWQTGAGQTIPLVENFRSREGILNFVNSVFSEVMKGELGGVEYDDTARLQFGAAAARRPLSVGANPIPPVELHLRFRHSRGKDADDEQAAALNDIADLQESEKEARLIGQRLCQMIAGGHKVWDEETGRHRAAHWRDITVLLRSPSRKAESFAKEFSKLGIPLVVARSGFYETTEISDLLSLLRILDNPLQDIPLLAVLHSPLVGLGINDLAEIRLAKQQGPFWGALLACNGTEREIVAKFLDRYARWRRMARQASLSRCLETVLAETHYDSWLLTQSRGEQRRANVQRLLGLAQRFDKFQRHSLFRFLLFVEAQQLAESEPEVATSPEENSVRLMSIHQSKGLEFPIVVLGDIGKTFNLLDLRAGIILDQEYGLSPQIKPPHTGKKYPSLPYWLAKKRRLRELLGEELRLLYVAMTRARDHLILSGTLTDGRFAEFWQASTPSVDRLASARTYADWLGMWFSRSHGLSQNAREESNSQLLQWFIHDDKELAASSSEATGSEARGEDGAPPIVDAETIAALKQRLSWTYPFNPATKKAAKASVTLLRRQAAELDAEAGAESIVARFPGQKLATWPARRSPRSRGLSASETGNAHHLFLQHVSLARTSSIADLKAEAGRLGGILTKEQAQALDFGMLARFWQSPLGARIPEQAPNVRRELPFTARFAQSELDALIGADADNSLQDEFVVVQGIADLLVLLPHESWLVDFKTDDLSAPEDVQERAKLYEPQLKLYAAALARIYKRPVSEAWLCFLTAGETIRVETNGVPHAVAK